MAAEESRHGVLTCSRITPAGRFRRSKIAAMTDISKQSPNEALCASGSFLYLPSPTCVSAVMQWAPHLCHLPPPLPGSVPNGRIFALADELPGRLPRDPVVCHHPLPSPEFAFGAFSPPRFSLFFPAPQNGLFCAGFLWFSAEFCGRRKDPLEGAERGAGGVGRGTPQASDRSKPGACGPNLWAPCLCCGSPNGVPVVSPLCPSCVPVVSQLCPRSSPRLTQKTFQMTFKFCDQTQNLCNKFKIKLKKLCKKSDDHLNFMVSHLNFII